MRGCPEVVDCDDQQHEDHDRAYHAAPRGRLMKDGRTDLKAHSLTDRLNGSQARLNTPDSNTELSLRGGLTRQRTYARLVAGRLQSAQRWRTHINATELTAKGHHCNVRGTGWILSSGPTKAEIGRAIMRYTQPSPFPIAKR